VELTIEQALQQGVAAHKEGNLQEAERLYRAILQSQAAHPDANHNLGVIAVSVNKAKAALPLFKTALEANPKIEQFWLSYIDALIKENQFAAVKQALAESRKMGLAGEKLDVLEAQYKQIAQSAPSKLQAKKKGLTLKEKRQKISESKQQKKKKGKSQNANSVSPSQSQLNNILEQYQNGQYDEAEKLAVLITQQYPEHQFGWKILGAIFGQTGRKTEALNAKHRAVQLAPQDAEAHGNLGNTLRELSRLKEAEASYRQAIALKSGYAEAYNNLGITLKELGRLEAAIDSYKQALKIKPDYAEAYINMGTALRGVIFSKPRPDLQEIITSLLNRKNYVRPKSISGAAISLLKFEPVIKQLSKKYSAGEPKRPLQETISELSGVPLLLKLMSVCPLADLELEGILTDIRSSLLSFISEVSTSPVLLCFQSALALQCFTNEYIYNQTDEETEKLGALEMSVKKILADGQQPSPNSILCLASYKALHNYKWVDLLVVKTGIDEVFTRQFLEPNRENRIKFEIPILEEITDKVSSKVRGQYEENPYPRWVSLGLPLRPVPISKIVNNLKLRLFDNRVKKTEFPNILIAGCGTGQHSISTTARFLNSRVLAVDLSLASLAYAKRKTEELGIQNVEYMQADILDLGKLDRQFDIIESEGVLHHMDDPIAGWKVLTDCLKPGGLMNIALYSELARQPIVTIRDEINQSGIASSYYAMKLFRHSVINSDKKHHKSILKSGDFYNMSTLRDLLFHVQEHRFTLPQIQDYLSQLGLIFCGFEADEIVRDFKMTNIGLDDPYDLDKWNCYEEANPYKFRGMYQFWCQKIA
jgi:Flp pilus assembly protein TadD/SAM-dependent methyltransferase